MNTQFVWPNQDGTFTDPIWRVTGTMEEMKQFAKTKGYNNTEILPIPVKNAKRCDLCGSAVDRYPTHFQCTNIECGSMGDSITGIMEQLDLDKIRKSMQTRGDIFYLKIKKG